MYLQDIYWLPDSFVSQLVRPFSEREWIYGLFNGPLGSSECRVDLLEWLVSYQLERKSNEALTAQFVTV
jgi:hypothetical protein